MDQAAQDDAERQRNRAKLYAPPKGYAKQRGAARRALGRDRASVQAMLAQVAAEDARLTGGASG